MEFCEKNDETTSSQKTSCQTHKRVKIQKISLAHFARSGFIHQLLCSFRGAPR